MSVEDDERQPLLGADSRQRGREMDDDIKTPSGSTPRMWIAGAMDHIRTSWKVYQAVCLLFLAMVSYYGQVSAMLELTRDLTCARYYEHHPELIDPTERNPCSADEIEKQSARIMLVGDLIKGGCSALSMLFFGKKFSSWGRKPILLIGFSPYMLLSLMAITIPRGYPYGPLASESIISPSNCIYIFLGMSATAGLLGGDNLAVCSLRILLVDNSSSADRTKNLLALTVANLLGLTVGPLLFAALSYLIPISVNGVDGILNGIFQQIFHIGSQKGGRPLLNTDIIGTMTDSPTIPDARVGHGNVTPFIACLAIFLLASVYVIFFVSETANHSTTRTDDDEGRGEDKAASISISPVKALLPIRRKDNTLDWRVTLIFISLLFHYAGAYTLNPYILYFGHVLQWGASKVDYLLSSIGLTRMICIFSFVPACVIYFERTVNRPNRLKGLKVEEIHLLARSDYGQETPRGDSAFVTPSSDRDAQQDGMEGGEEEEDVHLLQGAIALWRARVDRTIVRLSWSFDILGWSVVAIGAVFRETYTLLLGGALLGFGSGGQPALQSFGVAITSDVLTNAEKVAAEEEGNESGTQSSITKSTAIGHEHAGEVFFSLLSLLESVSQTVMPIVSNLIYTASLSTFPAASFFVAAFYYVFAFFTLSFIVIHQSS